MPRSESTQPESVNSVPARDVASRPECEASASVEQLFREHNDSLLRFLTARLHSPQEAKEVAQEAYVRMLGLRDTQAVSFLQAYLFRTAANLASNRLRDRAGRERIDQLVFFETPEEPSPEHATIAEEEMQLLCRAVDELPEPCRSAFILSQFHELPINDVAKTLGLHPRRVRRFVKRAAEHCHAAVYEPDRDHGGES